ncbi:GL20969 [Drosophila persimilis]|uniref:GL20969 n=1 Tax=Drosophila persimilis TaxID=7234 RepID=B4IRN2_DROPE|nr:GL20969 [Drosophila persimilis]
MLEAIKLRIDYEWKEIRNNYERKENFSQTETSARDRGRDLYKDRSKQQVIPNEDIKYHLKITPFRPRKGRKSVSSTDLRDN